jgi:hypothetical protein
MAGRHARSVERIGDRPQTPPLLAVTADPIRHFVGNDVRAAQADTGCLLLLESFPRALTDQPALKLRRGGDNTRHQFAGRARGVDAEVNAAFSKRRSRTGAGYR